MAFTAAGARLHAADRGKARKRGILSSDAYAGARTELALEQAERVRQIRLEAEGKLVDAAEVRRFLVQMGQAHNVRLRSIEKRLRARFPRVDREVVEFLRDAHEDALSILAADVMKAE
jgi:phage terminase Nu1 subunit (DNA packaging protein)